MATVCLLIVGIFGVHKYRHREILYTYSYLSAENPISVLIGDSYGINHVNDDGTGWTGWGETLSKITPELVAISSCGGSGLIGGVSLTFETQLSNVSRNIDNPELIQSVVIVGGYNDVSTSRSYEGINDKLHTFVDNAKKMFPNSKLFFLYVSKNYVDVDMECKLASYESVFKRACLENNVDYLKSARDLLGRREYTYFNEEDANNGFHPSTEGNRVIADYIVENILK